MLALSSYTLATRRIGIKKIDIERLVITIEIAEKFSKESINK
jgi:hypothetical protein